MVEEWLVLAWGVIRKEQKGAVWNAGSILVLDIRTCYISVHFVQSHEAPHSLFVYTFPTIFYTLKIYIYK